MSKNSFLAVLFDKLGFIIFLLGKLIRFSMYFGFLYFLVSGTSTLAGYNLDQTLFFFLTFNAIDIIGQFLFRGVYRFRSLVVSGGLDLVLVKPINPLFRSLMGEADLIDLVTIPPLIIAIYYFGFRLEPSFIQVVLYILLVVNGLLISTAFHILVLSMGIITLEVDHTIMIFRDIISLGRFPIDIYKDPLKSILTFIIPVGLMISIPAKAFFGLLDLPIIILSFAIGVFLVIISLKYWNFALKKYTSASS